MTRPKLTLFLDVVSPFAYMAFYVTKVSLYLDAQPATARQQAINAKIFKDCDVTYVPIFLGGVMKACGNTPPIQIKNKDKWIGIERLRWARYCNIPMAEDMPEDFPPLTLHVMRALCALQLTKPEKMIDAYDALYNQMWVQGKVVHKPEGFTAVFSELLGEETAKEVVGKSSGKEAKDLLMKNTDSCLAEGAFGLPWFVATNAQGQKESYWGFDHLGQVIQHLGLDRQQVPELKAML